MGRKSKDLKIIQSTQDQGKSKTEANELKVDDKQILDVEKNESLQVPKEKEPENSGVNVKKMISFQSQDSVNEDKEDDMSKSYIFSSQNSQGADPQPRQSKETGKTDEKKESSDKSNKPKNLFGLQKSMTMGASRFVNQGTLKDDADKNSPARVKVTQMEFANTAKFIRMQTNLPRTKKVRIEDMIA